MSKEAIADISVAVQALLNAPSTSINTVGVNSPFWIVLTTSCREISTDFPLTYACCLNSTRLGGICRLIRL